jgi:hypothetical protein
MTAQPGHRQAQRFCLDPSLATFEHLKQPFLKSLATNGHGPFLTGFPNLVNSSF